MASSNSPCAACKFLRRKCTQECVFAPYFPPDQPQKFANVHKVFGASNVAKLLNELNPSNREDAVNSLAYEAEMRLRDPVYGCVGLISLLEQKLKETQVTLYNARKELADYIGPSAMQQSMVLHQQLMHPNGPFGMSAMALGLPPGPSPSTMALGLPPGASAQSQMMIRDPQQQHHQLLDAQQQFAVVVAARDQELMRNYEQQQQQQQQELVRFNAAFDGNNGGGGVVGGSGGGGGFNQMSTSLAMVPIFENQFHHQDQPQPIQSHPPPPPSQQQQRSASDEGTSTVVGPSA